MVTLSWTVHTRYLLWEPQPITTNLTEVTMPDQVQGTTMGIETDKGNPGHSLMFEGFTAPVIMIPIEAAVDHNTAIDEATTGAAHDDLAPPIEAIGIDLTMTHYIDHITDHPHIEALQVIDPKIAVDHIHDHPTNLQGMNHIDQVHNPAGQEENHTPRRTQG